jgi:acetyl-CoA carboxylase biotin carboxyl carrier protein
VDLKEIKQIIELMTTNELSHFHLERDGMKIKLKKGMDADAVMEQINAMRSQQAAPVAAAPAPVVPVQVVAPGSPPPATGGDGEIDAPAAGEIEITSPMVGTFYTAASPENPPFVEKGSEVTEDSVVCIVEAMKVMNEIKAELKGTITRVIAENGTPVQYGEPLFHLRPA